MDLTPSAFAKFVLRLNLYDWNVDALNSIGRGWMTSVVAANGSGKTTMLVAPSILWFLTKFPRGQVPVTSSSWDQVQYQVFPALQLYKNHPMFKDWKWNQCHIDTPQGGFVHGFSTNEAGRAEGWHPKSGWNVDPVFFVVDECKTVPDGIFESVDRCTKRFQLFVSSPGPDSGQFYRCFHSEKRFYWTRQVSSLECPHISSDKRARDKEKYGEDSPVYRSMHLAEFTELDAAAIISKQELREAIDSAPKFVRLSGKLAFCDFAAGGDENVIAVKDGNRAWIHKAWHDQNTMRACAEFVHHFKMLGLEPGQIFGDNGGLGKVMIDCLTDHFKFPIRRVDNGSIADDPEYANKGSEIWFTAARDIKRHLWILGDEDGNGIDPATFDQITSRRVCYAARQHDAEAALLAEKKPDMKARGVKSPDRADALLGVIAMSAAYGQGVIRNQYEAKQIITKRSSHKVPLARF